MTLKELDDKILFGFNTIFNNESEKAYQLCTEILEQCTKRGYLRGIGGCHAVLSKIFSKKGEWNNALIEAEQAFSYFDKVDDRLSAAHQLHMIAYLHSQTEQNNKALNYCFRTLKQFQELNDERGEAEAYSLLGSIFGSKSEYESALENLKNAYTLKIKLKDFDGAGSDCINIGAVYLYKDENERAIGYLRQAIELKEQYKAKLESSTEGVGVMVYSYNGYTLLRKPNDSTLADAYLNLGIALSAMGNDIEAIETLDKALKIKQAIGDKYGEAVAYNQLGSIHVERYDYPKAEWYFLQVRPLFETLGNKHSEGTVWYNLGRIYIQTERTDFAYQALEKAEQLFQGLDNPYNDLFILQQKSALGITTSQFEQAQLSIQRGLEVSRKIAAREFEIEFLKQQANLQEVLGDFRSAIETCNSAITIAREQKLPSQEAKILQSTAGLHKKNGDFQKALELFEQFHTIQENIINTQSARHLAGMQVLHETEIHRKNEEIARTKITHLESLIETNNQSIFMYKKELNKFRSDILSITKQLDKAENIVRKVKNKLRESSLMQESWDSYLETFTKVHPDFQSILCNKYPDLTDMEIKICILIRAGLQSEAISQILSLSPRTIENHRFNLRKKLNLTARGSLGKCLQNL